MSITGKITATIVSPIVIEIDEAALRPKYGPELVVDGDFSGDGSAWTTGTGWSVVGGQGVYTSPPATANYQRLSQSATFVATKTYRLAIKCSEFTGTAIDAKVYLRMPREADTSSDTTFAVTGVGEFVYWIVAGSDLTGIALANLGFLAGEGCKIDSISFRELL